MKIAIIGSRKYKSKSDVMSVVAGKLLSVRGSEVFPNSTVIISGGAEGVDAIVKDWTKRYEFKFIEVLPDFDKQAELGAQIYHDRNDKIIEMADKVIAIWNGNKVHSGTYSVITKCLNRKKNIEVIFVK